MNIPVEGWYAIAFIATLAFIVIMRLAKRGVDLSVGDKKLSIGGLVDEKIGKIKDCVKSFSEWLLTLMKRQGRMNVEWCGFSKRK